MGTTRFRATFAIIKDGCRSLTNEYSRTPAARPAKPTLHAVAGFVLSRLLDFRENGTSSVKIIGIAHQQ